MLNKEINLNTPRIISKTRTEERMRLIQKRAEKNSPRIHKLLAVSGLGSGTILTGRWGIATPSLVLSAVGFYFDRKNQEILYRVNKIIKKRYTKKGGA